MLYKGQKVPWMIAFIIYAIAIILTMMGAAPPAANVLVAVIGFGIGLPAGLHPAIIIWGNVIGTILGALVPWGNNGIVIKGTLVDAGYEAEANTYVWLIFLAMFIVTTLVLLLLFFMYNGHKIRVFNVEKPAPFNRNQIITLVMICIMVALLTVPGVLSKFITSELLKSLVTKLDVQGLSAIGFTICALMNLADSKEVVKNVPWNVILLVGGMGMLISVATKAGVVDLLANWLNSSVPVFLKVPFMALLAGFLSIFTAAIPTVVPMLFPMVTGIVAGTTIKPITAFIAIVLGASYTACSPFSSGGAVCMSNCSDPYVRPKLVGMQLKLAICVLLGLVIISATGILGIF